MRTVRRNIDLQGAPSRVFGKQWIFGVGPQKCGTSWIHELLKTSGAARVPAPVKETFFFDRRFAKGFAWYAAHFANGEGTVFAEVAPTYFHSRSALRRIAAYVPHANILVTLRDPLDRLVSLHRHYLRYGLAKGSLKDVLDAKPELFESSLYGSCLAEICSLYPRNQVSVLLLEDLLENPRTWIAKLNELLSGRLPEELESLGVVNESRAPGNFYVARLASSIADFLRDRRVFWPIEAARRCGVKEAVFSRRSERRRPSAAAEADEETALRSVAPYLRAIYQDLSAPLVGVPTERRLGWLSRLSRYIH